MNALYHQGLMRAVAPALVYALLLLLPNVDAASQDIPVGTWRLHLSYNSIRFVEVSDTKIFGATHSGVLSYDLAENSVSTLNKLNGLSSSGISSIAVDGATKSLVVGYSDGTLDIIQDNTVTDFTRLRDADVTTAKAIRDINVHGSLAYLSTAYGIVVFDLRQLEIKETWRDLGMSGETLGVLESTFLRDSIFLATDTGIVAGHMNDNLLDFRSWTRFNNTSNFEGPIHGVTPFNGKMYAAAGQTLYKFTGSAWTPVYNATETITHLSSSTQNLLLISGQQILMLNPSGGWTEITDPMLVHPAAVKQDETGTLWIGDLQGGLLSRNGAQISSYLPNGPTSNDIQNIAFDAGKIYALSGGLTDQGQPLQRPGHVNTFQNGRWSMTALPANDLTDISIADGYIFIASFGSGLNRIDAAGNTHIFDESNSPLLNGQSGDSRLTALASAADGLWVANYEGNEPLHLLKTDGSWESFAFSYPNAQRPTALALDGEGRVWMALSAATGGGLLVYDRQGNRDFYRSTATGAGALPHQNVFALSADRNGYMWVGTGAGVAYFFSPDDDAIRPIFDNRFLLKDQKVTTLAIDGANRKWIGTDQGAWLFEETGETLIHHFTEVNSPLPSNVIRSVAIDRQTGEVFFATDRGIASYRSDAVDAGPRFENVKIFPNPVHPGYTGTVAISGLAQDAAVRITDISGKLVWRTEANGGIATWHVRDHQGRRAVTGIYLVFATSADGSESVVGKVAVIE